jgi:hypothetical protein
VPSGFSGAQKVVCSERRSPLLRLLFLVYKMQDARCKLGPNRP